MNTTQIMQIFTDTAYVRMGGSPEEKKCAEYLKTNWGAMGPGLSTKQFMEQFQF